MPGAGLTSGTCAKALSDRPALQPYWGKPTVRNDRGDGGNVGIIRSPLRATVLPDRENACVPTGLAYLFHFTRHFRAGLSYPAAARLQVWWCLLHRLRSVVVLTH